jgi:protein phosphatase
VAKAAPPEPRARADRAADRPGPIAPRAPRPPAEEHHRPRWLAPAFITALLLLPLCGGGYLASQAVYFLGVAGDGSVTVFQGLPYDLPFGIHLYSSQYETGLTPAQLPGGVHSKLLDHKLRSHDDALDLARQLELGQVAGVR